MKRNYPLLLVALATLSLLSGKLSAGISFMGRMGINTFYKEYQFFKIWWKAGLICLIFQLLLLGILYLLDRRLPIQKSRWIILAIFLGTLVGLYFTFIDFSNNASHRWLGEKFHLSIYVYWIGWAISSLFFLTTKVHRDLSQLIPPKK